jgi:hypothetical protein
MLEPLVIAAGRDFEYPTHRLNRVLVPMGFNELVGLSNPSFALLLDHGLLPGLWI